MKIVTYATHAQGTFDDLMNSGHPIEVLGWGSKWGGFTDKFNGVLEYLDTLPDDELVVFVDGFDSVINRDLDEVEELFESLDCKVLISHDNKTGFTKYLPEWFTRYTKIKVFGTCEKDWIANTGLYMGRASELKDVLTAALEQGSDDDQRNFNSICSQFPYIKVDVDCVIFENCSSIDDVRQSRAFFSQMPGTLSVSRLRRSCGEYLKYFILEIIIIVLLALLVKKISL